jgi:hypothetical protein
MRTLICLMVAVASGGAFASNGGIAGTSGKNPAYTCANCHFGGTAPAVTLNGPTALAALDTATYTFTVVTASATHCAGLDVAASAGTLSSIAGSTPATSVVSNEITHVAPTVGMTVQYSFQYTAPATSGPVTLYADGLDGDHDGTQNNDSDTTTTLQIMVVPAGTDLATGGSDLSAPADMSDKSTDAGTQPGGAGDGGTSGMKGSSSGCSVGGFRDGPNSGDCAFLLLVGAAALGAQRRRV